MEQFKLSVDAQEKLQRAIIQKLLGSDSPLPDFVQKLMSEKLDIPTIIDRVREGIPTPQDGRDAKISDELLSDLVIRVLERVQEIHQVKDGDPGTDGRDGKDGTPGRSGFDGKDGRTGPQGVTGLNGQAGPRGNEGPRGDTGKQGPRGVGGKDGRNGVDGKPGRDGSPGQDYTISEKDFQSIISKIDFEKFLPRKELEKEIEKLKKQLQTGKIQLPTTYAASGGGLTGAALVREISRVLETEEWKNGLPSDGSLSANLNSLQLTTGSPDPLTQPAGLLWWNDAELTVNISTGLGPVLQVGQEVYILIYNGTGSPIVNGTVLRPLSATVVDDVIIPTVELSQSNVFSGVEGTIMLATMLIPDGEIGLATRFGRVRGVDTSLFGEGDALHVSATVPGGLTNVRPEFPNYDISLGGVLKSHATEGEIFVSITRDIFDTTLNFWNGTFRETINFMVSSNGSTVTGMLQPDNGHPDMTMFFSDGLSMLDTSPALTIVLTPGTANIPQQNFIFVPESTKVLTVSLTGWPTTEHIKVATVVLRTAAITQTDGALKNHNWNDHIENTTTFQGHLSHITEKLRQFEAQWDSGVEGSVTIDAGDVWAAVTAGVVYQLHKQGFPALDMETGDDIHVVNHFTTPYVTEMNLNTQTADSLGNTLANSSFSFVVWGVQNKSGQQSHLMLNLPSGSYAKNAPANAVSDALNYSSYEIPKIFQGVGFLIARFTFVLEADGTTWSLFATEDLRGTVPNTSAGGGAGGSGASSWTGLTDTPSAYTGLKGVVPRVNEAETALELVALKSGTLASPPSGLFIGERWEDTTDSADHPVIRVSKVTT